MCILLIHGWDFDELQSFKKYMFKTLVFKALLDSFEMIHILLLPWKHIILVLPGGTKMAQLLIADKHWNKIMSHFVSLHPPRPI